MRVIYLGKQLGYKERSDWYKISKQDFLTHYGERLFRKHTSSPSRVVMETIPDHPWLPFLFRPHKKTNVGALEKYVRQMEEQIGIKGREEWYNVERANVAQIKQHFADMGNFVDRVLRVVYPDHKWEVENFKNFSKGTTQHRLKELLTRLTPSPLSSFLSTFRFLLFIFLTCNIAVNFQGEKLSKTTPTHCTFSQPLEKS
jgi:hypothetical protein